MPLFRAEFCWRYLTKSCMAYIELIFRSFNGFSTGST